MPLSDTLEGDHRGCVLQGGMIRIPAARRGRHGEFHAALGREFEGVGQQILQHLLQALRVGDDAAVELGRNRHFELQPAVLRLVAERAAYRLQQIAEVDLFSIDRHGSGFDLGQIEDVADEIQQIGPRAVDGAREFHLFVAQVSLRILGQLLAENQDAVERRCAARATYWPGIPTCTSTSARAPSPSPRPRGGPARFPGSSLPPRRCGRRAAALSAPAARWSAAIRAAGSAVRWPAAGTA